jgi:peptidoglycan/LPS O-acetylase OafA/YrhL
MAERDGTRGVESFTSAHLEFFRWISAFAVVVMHATALLLSQADIMAAPHNVLEYFWWFVSSPQVGHKAVIGFFVISGYLVGGAAIRQKDRGRRFYLPYFCRRFSRIYIVLLPALIFTWGIDALGGALFKSGGFYDNPMFLGHSGAATLLLNLLNLQNFSCEAYGTNLPLWSLSLEVWYYVTFPLLLAPFSDGVSAVYRFVLSVAGVILCLWFSSLFAMFFWGYLIWALGAWASVARRPLIRPYWVSLGIFLVANIVVRLVLRGPLLEAFPALASASDLFCAVVFANLLLSSRFATSPIARLGAFSLPIPNFTYSLYLTHLPIIVFARAWADQIAPGWALQLATAGNWLVTLLAIAAAGVFAYFFSLVTEARTARFRDFLLDKLGDAR